MESTLIIVSIIAGIIGTITGVSGLFLAVISTKRHAQELAEEKERHAQERAEEKERHAQERAEEKELHAQERAEEKELHAQELETQKQEMARTNRLMFLADRIFDPTIPRELRLPFYEEYLSMGGNGTAVKFWLIEGEREKKTQHPA